MTPNWTPRRHADDAEGPLQDHDRLHAEGRHARPRHDVPHLHGADQPRLLLRSRHGEEAARRRSRCSRSRPRCSPIRRSPKASRTASCRSARRSGATPTTQRAGMLPWAFEPGMGFERYVDYALDVPMYFVKRGDSYIDVAGQVVPRSARRQAAVAAGRARRPSPTGPTTSRRSFPEVRLKRYLEMRGADGGPWRRLPALPAFWVGLLYDDDSARRRLGHGEGLDRARSARSCATTCRGSASRPTIRGRSAARPRPGDAARSPSRGSSRRAAARSQRPRRDALSAAAQEIVARGITPAEELLEKFHGAVERLGRAGVRRIRVLMISRAAHRAGLVPASVGSLRRLRRFRQGCRARR